MEPSNDIIFVLSFCLISFLVVARKEIAFETSEDEIIAHRSQTLKLSSFLSSSTCRKGDKKRGSLEVFHRQGPCSKFNEDMVKPLTMEELFSRDQSRVDSIRSRLTIKNRKKDPDQGSKASLPAKPDPSYGEYLVTVGLGTPTQYLSFIGSDQTWTQCQPCSLYCYKQQEPIFAPSFSSTYSNISCTECSELMTSATKRLLTCSSSTCDYSIGYVDGSKTTGFLGKEKLTLSTPDDVIDGFLFGCGQNQQGPYGGAAGLMGLGRDKVLSIVFQTADKYGKAFSYCLPSTASSTGYLTFGSSVSDHSNVSYTPLSTSQETTFYALDLEAIYVGGNKLAISPTVFTTSGMIIDSGTTLTFLPPTAYSALRKAFRAEMTQYPLTNAMSPFDTCYGLSKYSDVTIPNISMVWGGNVNLDIPSQGILYPIRGQVYCL